MQRDWYDDFFHGLALEAWRQAVSDEQTRSEADFIGRALGLPGGARILDVPCGNGRHSIELAKSGFQVTGIDLSTGFLSDAREAAVRNNVNIEWLNMDMRNVGGLPPFDGAFCFGNSFGYMQHDDSVRFLAAVSACLKSNARFILETGLAAESLLPAMPGKRWYKLRDMFQLSEAEYDASLSQLKVHYTFVRGNEIQSATARYSLYTVAELKRLFHAAGFGVSHLYGSTNCEPYKLGSRLIIVAEKGVRN